ncbi:MAG: hypothetical protein DRH97_00005 [Chloroflexi bacterium]|nr:MAG: hypothetical protein DRH97_00005 [Chloroflexota bacterium]
MTKIFPIILTPEQRKELESQAMRHGYMNLSAYMRDKSMCKLDSDEIKTLKAQNAKLMKLIEDKEV